MQINTDPISLRVAAKRARQVAIASLEVDDIRSARTAMGKHYACLAEYHRSMAAKFGVERPPEMPEMDRHEMVLAK